MSKTKKVLFEIIYEGDNPPSAQEILTALVEANIDEEGIIKVKEK
jgi:hypothetical protein